MGQKAEYKSAQRSRKLLRDAYASLMMEKPIDKITVTDITNRAGLNRGTFYAHYANPAALRGQLEQEIVDRILGLLKGLTMSQILREPMTLFVPLVQLLYADEQLYRHLLLSRESGPFLEALRELFATGLLPDSLPEETRHVVGVRIRFVAGGIISLCQDWFAGKVDGSLEDMFRRLAPSITGSMLPEGGPQP